MFFLGVWKKIKLKFDRKWSNPEFLKFEILFLTTYDFGLDLSSRPKNSMYKLEMSNFSYLNGMTHVFSRCLKKIKLKFRRKQTFLELFNSEIVFW